VAATEQRLGRQRLIGRERDSRQSQPFWDDHRPSALEDPQLRGSIGVERPVAVEMVGLEVEQHRHLAGELVHILELERRQLADHPVRRADRRERRADVSRNDDVALRGTKDRAEELRGRRLPVGAGDADEPCLRQKPVAELDLRPDRNSPFARLGDERALPRHAGVLDDELDVVEQREIELVAERPVDGCHVVAAFTQPLRR
jgi:hypothetical protein